MPHRVLDLIARQLAAYRKQHALSQEEAAEQVGCSLPTYRSLEQGTYHVDHLADPRLSTIMRVATTLHLEQDLIAVFDAGTRKADGRE
ncbi:helix-turn-helix transcriptional regulator [Microbacterium sufflavum]|uniref:helix-turn-helix transcriptional regulator n=1 Tax=Microbacterium sufflavum TaxID=2851649 RepID=UPI00345178C6